MVSSIVTLKGHETNFIDEGQLRLTVKISPTQYGQTSYDDVFRAIDKAGIKPDDIGGMYKVSPNDFTYSLLLNNSEAKKLLIDKKVIGEGKKQFSVVRMTEQCVKLKIHWLPLFYDNMLLDAVFSDYGEVLKIDKCKSAYANVCAYNGVREVLLKTDEIHKQQIPHLVKLESGHAMLITMQGRPPLCLKCHTVGHLRKDCPTGKKSYSTAHVEARPDAPVPPTDPQPTEPPAGANSEPVGEENAPSPQDLGADGLDDGETATVEEVPMEAGDSSSKRKMDDDDLDSSFIKPNRTARQKVGPPQTSPLHLPLSDRFHEMLGDLSPS